MVKSSIESLMDKEQSDTPPEPPNLAGFPILPVSTMTEFFNILIYGEPGVGKTVLAGSSCAVPEMSPVLVLDVEGGTMSLGQFYSDVHVIRVKNWRDLQKIYDRLYRGGLDYKTVIVDSLSEAQKLSMAYIMDAAVKEDDSLDRDVPTQRAWGQNLNQMRRFVRGMRDLQMNVIFTALVDSDKNNKGKNTFRPSFQGKTKAEVPGFMDIVAYYYMVQKGDDNLRLLLSHQTDSVLAKDRSNKLPKLMENPTMTDIYREILGTNNTTQENTTNA